jgi:hypothetical protein
VAKKTIKLRKGDVRIKLEYLKKKVVLQFDFPEKEKENLDDYIYLLEKIERYMKSGEYSVQFQGLDAPKSP